MVFKKPGIGFFHKETSPYGILQTVLMAKKARTKRKHPVPMLQSKVGFSASSKKDKMPAAVRKLMNKGMGFHKAGRWLEAEKAFSQAWKLEPDSFSVLAALAQTYSEMGARSKAIELLEKALSLHGPSETLLGIMGQMATNMSMHDIGERVWRMILPFNPGEPSYYENLAGALIEQEKFDEAITLLNDTIQQFPTNGGLWNSLGVVAQARQQFAEARVFYREAISHYGRDHRFWSNLASTEEDRHWVLLFAQRALDLKPDCHETHMLLATLNFRKGFVAEAWDHWEHRLAPTRAKGQNVSFRFSFPRWQGECLSNKTILISGEQGIGDEVFFYKSLRHIYAQAKQLIIAAEPRLVSILQRTFPCAIVKPYETESMHGYSYRGCQAVEELIENGGIKIDYFSPIASTWPHAWGPNRIDIPVDNAGYLSASPGLVKKWKKRIEGLGGQLNIGISWESQNKALNRVGGYTDVGFWRDVAQIDGVNLVCLQYGDVSERLAQFTNETGVKIHVWQDTDLKHDIEANLAIMANMDFVVGPAVATQMFSMALGAKTLLLARGRPWWNFGSGLEEKQLNYAPNLRWIDNHIHLLDYGTKEREAYKFWPEAEKEVRAIILEAIEAKKHLVASGEIN